MLPSRVGSAARGGTARRGRCSVHGAAQVFPAPFPPSPPSPTLFRASAAGRVPPASGPAAGSGRILHGGQGAGKTTPAPPVPPASGRGRSGARAALPPCAAAPAGCRGWHPPPSPRPTGGGATPGTLSQSQGRGPPSAPHSGRPAMVARAGTRSWMGGAVGGPACLGQVLRAATLRPQGPARVAGPLLRSVRLCAPSGLPRPAGASLGAARLAGY